MNLDGRKGDRNRFTAVGAPHQLIIQSSYWRGGSNDWSAPTTCEGGTIGAVDHFILHTGAQADGYNTGFLAYVPQGSNEIRFRVFHFSWPENPRSGRSPRGLVHYSGSLPTHDKTIVPESLRFTRTASRMCDMEWRAEDGSSCSARLNKFKESNTIAFKIGRAHV